MYELEKKFRFEMAHRLSHGYDGKCANIHGHSWNGSLFIQHKNHEIDEFGMLLDYGDIKKLITEIEDTFDHKLVISTHDPMKLGLMNLGVVNKRVGGVVLMEGNPTSENIAKEIFRMAQVKMKTQGYFKAGFYVSKVVVEETCTVSCTYKGMSHENGM